MEFLSFESILNLLAAFGCGCLGITLLGRHSVFGLFMLALSAGLIGLSKQTADVDLVVTASFLGGWIESATALSFALIIYTFMAANSLKIGSSIFMIAAILVFALISTQLLQVSGLVIGPYFAMSGLIFATALCATSVYKMLFSPSVA